MNDDWNRHVGGQEDREYLAAGQGRGSGGLGRQAQQRLNSQPGNSYAKAAPWRERRAVGLRGPALGMASRRGECMAQAAASLDAVVPL